MDEQQIRTVFSDEAFVSSILEMETAEDVQQALAAKGITLSLKEIENIQTSLNHEEEELSEDQLENVAGGSLTAIICALIIGGAVVAGGVKLGQSVNGWTERRW